MLHRAADRDDEAAAVVDGQAPPVAVRRERHAVHELHDEVRAPRLRRARVEHAGHAGVIHERERLALGLEATDDLGRVHAEPP